MKKLLLVTFPVDLGNKTLEKRFIELFKDELDLKVHRFIPDQKVPNTSFKYFSTIGRRFVASFRLRQVVREANREGRQVLFHGISPALFAYPAVNSSNSCIVTDWTRKLYEPMTGSKMSPVWVTFIHRKVLNSQKYIIGLTGAVREEIVEDYGISPRKLKKGRLPFSVDLDLFVPSPKRNDKTIKILFVGGDFERKGGDVLLDWFAKKQDPDLKLTLVTGHPIQKIDGVTVENNVRYGQDKHVQLYKSHDLFVLPTKCDGYPSVIGEAACAGLALLTTKNALGGPEIIQEGINGYVCDSQEALIKCLDKLVSDKSVVELMKSNSRRIMEEEFSKNVVLSDYISCLFGQS